MHLGKFHIRVAGLLPVLILGFALVSAGTDTTQRDPYAENTVRAALTDTNGPTYAFTEKVLNRLGDRAAIGLIRVIGEQSSSLRPDQVRRMLQFIQTSFAYPEIISVNADRQPKATLLLLKYLEGLPESKTLKSEISETRAFVLRAAGNETKKNP